MAKDEVKSCDPDKVKAAIQTRSKTAIYEPGVHVFDVIFPQGVPIFVKEPGFDAGNARSQPLTVAERYGSILAAVQQQHRDQYLGRAPTALQNDSARPCRGLSARR